MSHSCGSASISTAHSSVFTRFAYFSLAPALCHYFASEKFSSRWFCVRIQWFSWAVQCCWDTGRQYTTDNWVWRAVFDRNWPDRSAKLAACGGLSFVLQFQILELALSNKRQRDWLWYRVSGTDFELDRRNWPHQWSFELRVLNWTWDERNINSVSTCHYNDWMCFMNGKFTLFLRIPIDVM